MNYGEHRYHRWITAGVRTQTETNNAIRARADKFQLAYS